MNSEINNIFNQSSCLTSREIEQYTSGSLSKEEIRRVELHLADCPMCSDEIDGYILLSDKNKLPVVVKDINNRIDKKISVLKGNSLHSSSEKSLPKRFVLIAASFILLLGIGYIINFYINFGNNNLADMSPLKEAKVIDETVTDKNISEDKINNEIKNINDLEETEKTEKNKVTEQKTIKIKENNFNESNVVSENKNNKKEIASVDDINFSDEISENVVNSSVPPEEKKTGGVNNIGVKKKVGKKKKKSAENISFMTTRGAKFNGKTVNTKEVEKYKSMRESALLSYSMKIYDEALKDFNYYLKYKPSDYEILYKAGFSYYKLRDYDKAISGFDKVIFEGVNKYVEDARWYKAKSLIKLGKTENAKTILNKIIAKNGKYQNKALDLLNTLN